MAELNTTNEQPGIAPVGYTHDITPSEPLKDYAEETALTEVAYPMTKREALKRYDIHLHFADVGCVIEIGCKSIAFNTTAEAMAALNEYVEAPISATEKWNKIFEQ